MSERYVFQAEGDIAEVGADWLERLKKAAEGSPLRRARLCLHPDTDDPLHEMIIAFCRDSYSPPHRHTDKSESFHLIEGALDVFFFDDAGHVTTTVEMAPGKTLVYRLQTNLWHTVRPRTDHVVIHEITRGPFRKEQEELAPFAPSPSDPAAIAAFWRAIDQMVS